MHHTMQATGWNDTCLTVYYSRERLSSDYASPASFVELCLQSGVAVIVFAERNTEQEISKVCSPPLQKRQRLSCHAYAQF
jgi:hypothetical protein